MKPTTPSKPEEETPTVDENGNPIDPDTGLPVTPDGGTTDPGTGGTTDPGSGTTDPGTGTTPDGGTDPGTGGGAQDLTPEKEPPAPAPTGPPIRVRAQAGLRTAARLTQAEERPIRALETARPPAPEMEAAMLPQKRLRMTALSS